MVSISPPVAVPSVPTIKPILLIGMSDTQLEQLKKRYNSNIGSREKDKIQAKLGGRCIICDGIAEHIASYDCSGAILIERYCTPCVKKTFSRTPKVSINGDN